MKLIPSFNRHSTQNLIYERETFDYSPKKPIKTRAALWTLNKPLKTVHLKTILFL